MTDSLLTLAAAAPLAGVTAGQLGRAARAGQLPGAVRDGGRWKVTEAGALAYAAGERRPGRPSAAGLEVEQDPYVRCSVCQRTEFAGRHVSAGFGKTDPSWHVFAPSGREWRARIDGGDWSASDTRDRAVKAAHAAARVRRLVEAQRRELASWHGAARGELADAGPVVRGDRIVVRRHGGAVRAVVIDVSGSGRVTAAWRTHKSDRARVTSLPPGAALVEEGMVRRDAARRT